MSGGQGREGVAVAMANWNGRRYVGRCLDAILAQSCRPAEIVVVDNGSTDGSREWIRATYPEVKVLENEKNEGFAAGYNRAIAASCSPCVLILNTDVFLAADFVEQALIGLGKSADTGAVTGRLYQEGTGEWVNGGFFLRPQIRIAHSRNLEVEEEVFGCTGALMLCRREMLEAIKLGEEYFDETYFSFGEDIDLAWRAQLAGWKARYCPAARAYHVGSGSLAERLRFIDKPVVFQRHVLKNRYLTLVKNASPRVLCRLLPVFLVAEPLVWLYLLGRRPRHFPQLLLALADVVSLLPEAWKKRSQIQRRAKVSAGHFRRFIRLY